MPSVMVDVDYEHGIEDRNITERSTVSHARAPGAVAAVELLDETYERARTRLVGSLTDEQAAKVPVMVPVPEHALGMVQAALNKAAMLGAEKVASPGEPCQ